MNFKELVKMPQWDWPDNAGEIILKVVRNHREAIEERTIAIVLACSSSIVTDDIVREILSIIENPQEAEVIRSTAVSSLGPVLEFVSMEDMAEMQELSVSKDTITIIRRKLKSIYESGDYPVDIRRQALQSSAQYPEEWHASEIRKHYTGSDLDWKLIAIFCMGYCPGFEEQILECVNSDTNEIRCNAIEAAGNQELEDAWPVVLRILSSNDSDKSLLLQAIIAAPRINPYEAIDLLEKLYEEHQDEEVTEFAAEALSEINDMVGDDDLYDDDDDDDDDFDDDEDDEFDEDDDLDDDDGDEDDEEEGLV